MRFLRLMAILWLLLATLIGSAVVYGRTYPDTSELQTLGFRQCDGKPCFMGIEPGVTSVEKASIILKEHGFTRSAVDDVYLLGRVRIGMQPDPYSRAIVGSVSVTEQTGTLLSVTLGDAVIYLGNPCGFGIGTSGVSLFYPYAEVSMYLGRLSPSTAIDGISILSGGFQNSCEDTTPWPGFTSSLRYWSLQEKRWSG